MSLPSKLKNFNLFVNATSYAGKVTEITLPKLTRKTEDYRGGGMGGPVKDKMGYEAMELQWTVGGYEKEVIQQFGITTTDGVLLRFAGALQDDSTGGIKSMEIVMRGAHTEMDMGTAKAGDKTEMKINTALSYYKISINGEAIIELDFVNMVEVINGVDLGAAERLALGL